MPRVLLITPFFAPMSRVGAKRPLMLARHLPAAGWEVVVLTSPSEWDPVDPGMVSQIPADLPVHREYSPARVQSAAPVRRTRPPLFTPNPYLGPFDRFLSHVPRAVGAARRLVKRYHPDVISVCADPFTALFTGAIVSRKTGVPFVADLRDPWALQRAKQRMRPWPSRRIVEWSERWALQRASQIVLNTEEAGTAYRAAYAGRITPDRFHVVRNAFDLALFDSSQQPANDRFTVLHFGQFRPLVPAAALLEAFAQFVRARRLTPADARLTVTGTFRPEDQVYADRLALGSFLQVQPDVPYRESLALLRRADVLAFVLDRRMEMTIPAKLYDYLAARRPIAALCDQPEPASIVRETGSGAVAPPEDPAAGAALLGQFYDQYRREELADLPADRVEHFSAEAQARRFAAVLDRAVAAR